ncbi:glycosyltransferase family 4 protein [Cytophagaceae bacterium ABcell3]|nr:glycosyltransferase family 4 protein [Cytophagaceae bacterium ABcell3]
MADNNKIKILMTADTIGGVWTYATELAKVLAPYNIHVHLATMGAPLSPEQQYDVRYTKNITVHESSYKLEWMENPWEDVEKAGAWLLELNKSIKPDLIHLNNYVHGSLPWGKPVLVAAHSCVLSWWQAVKNEDAPTEWSTYQQKVSEGLQAADLVIAPSQNMMHCAKEYYGPFKNSKVIYNGSDIGTFRKKSKKPIIFAMGRVWDEAKNLNLLAEIAAELPWPVYIAGDNQDPSNGELTNLRNVVFLGKLSKKEITKWLSEASIFVMPSRYEPFGLAMLEAGMSGCALVAGQIDSLAEIWENNAVFINNDDQQGLKECLIMLIENDSLRTSLANRAEMHSRRYDSRQMAENYFREYQKLLFPRKPAKSRIAKTEKVTEL